MIFIKRTLKIIFNTKTLIVFIIFSVISNSVVIYLNYKYANTYKDMENLNIKAIVVSLEKEKEYYFEYKIKIKDNSKFNNTYLLLKIKKEKKVIKLKYGNLINVKGEFSFAQKQKNYKGFNYREYLKSQKIHGILKTNSSNVLIIKENALNKFSMFLNNVRSNIVEKIENIVSKENKGLLLGILLGDKNEISKEVQENFKLSSLSHVLAVSGMHISYIILAIMTILNYTSLNKKASYIILIVIILLFMGITGFSPSVVRACIMAIITIISRIIYRRVDIFISMSISIFIILFENPFNIINVGFLLTYLGTLGIIIYSKIFTIKNNKTKDIIKKSVNFFINVYAISLCVQLLILPIIINNFNVISLGFLISNILVLQIFTIIIILGFFTIIISFISINLSIIIGKFLNICLSAVTLMSEKIAQIPFLNIIVTTPNILEIIVYYIIVLYIGYLLNILLKADIFHEVRKINKKTIMFFIKIYKNKSKYLVKILPIIIFVFIIFYIFLKIPKDLKIYFIDVGQGDSTLILTPENKTVLVDGGGNENDLNFDVGKNVLVPYLLDRKINKINYIMISHFDSDHVRTE